MQSRGRPKKDIDELDKEVISVKLSFHQIKTILYQYRSFQISSIEGQITKVLMHHLKKYLNTKLKEGQLPLEFSETLNAPEEAD
jgi:hypothetical protein